MKNPVRACEDMDRLLLYIIYRLEEGKLEKPSNKKQDLVDGARRVLRQQGAAEIETKAEARAGARVSS